MLVRRGLVSAVLAMPPGRVIGQAPAASGERIALSWGARAIPLITRATSTPGARTLTEAYLSQPAVMVGASFSWLRAHGTLNLEGLTLRRGELLHGAWGEGYVDRRHPHAYVHELMVGAVATGPWTASLFAGRGYVPFGSDDPMLRPFVGFPTNHHLAQILERLVAVGSIRRGVVTAEAALFNGDEPIDPSTAPLARRFGDSWAARATLRGAPLDDRLGSVELSTSYASLKSPEFREGAGLDQRKTHVGLRVAPASAVASRYALVEWARTVDVDRGRALYTFTSLLGEGALCRGTHGGGVALRVERSERPEEERLLNLFRAARPATDNSIVGVTRWTTMTAAVGIPAVRVPGGFVAPFVEVARIAVARASAGAFDPTLLYGSRDAWRMSGGARLVAGAVHDRMGRYGAAGQMALPQHTLQHSPVVREIRCFP